MVEDVNSSYTKENISKRSYKGLRSFLVGALIFIACPGDDIVPLIQKFANISLKSLSITPFPRIFIIKYT